MITKIVTPTLAIHTYLIIDPHTRKAAVIDPTRDIEPIISALKFQSASLEAILETHVHADFISGSKELKAHAGGKIYCSALGGEDWLPSYTDVHVKEGMEVSLGNYILQAWHTPGHTPEHLMWVLWDASTNEKHPIGAFTGDFLFFSSVGRPDLLGEGLADSLATDLYHSVFNILPRLPDEVEIFPAHGAGSLCGKQIGAATSSTLGKERRHNTFLLPTDKDKWVTALLKDMPAAPQYFKKMKMINVRGAKLINELSIPKRMEIKEMQKDATDSKKENIVLIDVRSKEEFAEGYLEGAINIPLDGSFIYWAPRIIPYDSQIGVIAKDLSQFDRAVSLMQLVGIDEIECYTIVDGFISSSSGAIQSFPLLPPEEVFELLKKDTNIQIIDVRSEGEWSVGHIENAVHVELSSLAEKSAEIPRVKTIGLVCGSGYRSSIAASILKRQGFANVFNMQGGMQDWGRAGLPVVL